MASGGNACQRGLPPAQGFDRGDRFVGVRARALIHPKRFPRDSSARRGPHRLTKGETEVATYAALGETGKLIGSRLRLSTSTVSGVLHDVMRKLRVRTQAELVGKLRSLGH